MLIYLISTVGVYLLIEITSVGYNVIKAIKIKDDKKALDEHFSGYRIRVILSFVVFVVIMLITLYKMGIPLY